MGIGEAVEAARKGIREADESLWGRFHAAVERFEPGCDADAVAGEASKIRFEAGEAVEALEELKEFLDERLASARGLDEKAERLTDDAHARHYEP